MKTIILLSSIIFCSTVLAQNPEFIIYNESGYLIYSTIASIVIDQEDVKWIGTGQGLFRFDGVNWKLYNKDNSPLPDNEILALDIDSEGNLWIGSETALSKFDGTNWIVNNDELLKLAVYNFNTIKVDTEDNVWFGCSFTEQTGYKQQGGLLKFDGENFTVYHMKNSKLPWYKIDDLDVDKDGNIWISTVKGFASFDGVDWLVYNKFNSLLPSGVMGLEIDAEGRIWIATRQSGLIKIDGEQWTIYNIYNSGLTDNWLFSLEIDSDGNKWILTHEGDLVKFNEIDWIIYNSSVGGFALDDEGEIWIVTSYGFARFDGTNWIPYRLTYPGIPDNNISDIAIDNLGNAWIATYGRGLCKFDGNNWTIYNRENSGLPSDGIFAMACDPEGNIWIGTEYGLVKFNGSDWIVYTVENSGLPLYNFVRVISVDKKGYLWIATEQSSRESALPEGGGLAKFDGEEWTVYTTENSGLPSNYVNAVDFDDNGNVWIGTGIRFNPPIPGEGGLAKFDGKDWTVFTTENSELPSIYISTINIDKKNTKWIGTMFTDGGLVKYDDTDWIDYNTENSDLPSNYIQAVSIDSQGNIWVGTHDGLAKFNGKDWTVFNNNNIMRLGNSITSIAIDNMDNIWIGKQNEGVVVYHEGGIVTGITENNSNPLPAEIASVNNYPNPFNLSTTITFALPASGFTTLTIYNIMGQNIRKLVSEILPSGSYSIVWDGKDNTGNSVSSGVYLSLLKNRYSVVSGRMLLVK